MIPLIFQKVIDIHDSANPLDRLTVKVDDGISQMVDIGLPRDVLVALFDLNLGVFVLFCHIPLYTG